MAYTNRPADNVVERTAYGPVTEYHDRVRWGPILAGLLTALATQLVLSALGAAIGLSSIAGSGAPRSDAGDVGTAVGIWSIISLFISLFIGGWITSRTCGPMNRSTALLNGAILWATTLAISSWLLASGVSGTFGLLVNSAADAASAAAQPGGVDIPNPGAIPSPPNISAQGTRDLAGNAAKAGWSFTFGSLLGLVASMVGASVGARSPRTNGNHQHS
ncbi:hypothetical protein NDA01_00635 [Trichocoleus desertorum AS-A10]|uniref:hypothetical protein n=1 Tax=Trichocoleus desertorum TaxID=1481672 RepID=UPI003298E357